MTADVLWGLLDETYDRIMDGEDDDRTKGEALGIARSIVAVMRPYATDPEEAMDNVRRVAHVRWCGRNGIDPDGDD